MCGGTGSIVNFDDGGAGLSPRVRGNPATCWRRCNPTRSIPACAGEPANDVAALVNKRVYPRVCGGTSVRAATRSPGQGLSPRVRGNPERKATTRPPMRSIPACAGEPGKGVRNGSLFAVYPRVCGGTSQRRILKAAGQGLSPRVRGNRYGSRLVRGGAGSIPACAGEPWLTRYPASAGRVYPRVCGGTYENPNAGISGTGLSPRVRGNRTRRTPRRPDKGSIPACAGEPKIRVNSPPFLGVYPRVCGGTHRLWRLVRKL